MDPLDLMTRARAGNRAAWDGSARQHQDAVFRLVYLFLGDPDEAEDVAQEAFIRAFNALDRFDTACPVRPWLLHMVTTP